MSLQKSIDAGRSLSVGERDTHDPQRVFDELAIRALEAFDDRQLAVARDEREIQHTGERRQALVGHRLFVQRPTVLVEALLVEVG